MKDQIIRLPEVLRRTGLSRSTLNRYEKAGTFPRRRKLGVRTVGWLESEIDYWMENNNQVIVTLQKNIHWGQL